MNAQIIPPNVTSVRPIHKADDESQPIFFSSSSNPTCSVYSVLLVQATEISVSQRFQPPNTDGNSNANIASGPPISTAGMTANTGPRVTVPRATLAFLSSGFEAL